jgi:hypothetical protein
MNSFLIVKTDVSKEHIAGARKVIFFCIIAWTDPERSRSLRLPDSKQSAHEGQPYAPAAFTFQEIPWYLFLLEAESTPVRLEGIL